MTKMENIQQEAKNIMNSNIKSVRLNLKERWQEEQEYEDFNNYKQVMKNTVEQAGYKLLKMTKTFRLTIKAQYGTYEIFNKGNFVYIGLVK